MNYVKTHLVMSQPTLSCESGLHACDAPSELSLAMAVDSPGWTYTGLTAPQGGEKPAGAWTAEETVQYMLERVRSGEFYIICPDNETTREMDHLRIMWAASDLVERRPALSRWHKDWKPLYEEYIRDGQAGSE